MLKILIILLLVFCMLSFYFKKIRKLLTIFIIALVLLPNNASAEYESRINELLPLYQSAMKSYGVPASFMIAIGIHETSLGTNSVAKALNRGKNLHGIKYHAGCYVTTARGTKFQKYSSEKDSINDLARLLSEPDGSYKVFNCSDKSKYPTREAMADCLVERLEKYAPRSENDTSLYKSDVKKIILSHPEYDEGLPSYEEAINLLKNTNSLPTISYGDNDEACYDEHNYGNERQVLEHYETTFGGSLDEGWLLYRAKQKEEWKKSSKEITEQDIDDAIDVIFDRARVTYTANMQYGRVNYDTVVEMLIETIPQDVMELMDNYWYTFDINNYLGNTLFGQCVWYAKHRALEILDNSGLDDATKQVLIESIKKTSGNGQDWYASPDGSLFKKSANVNEPKPGAIISWSHGQYGHVAIVESVYEKDGQTMLTISEGSRIKHDTDGDGKKDGWIPSSTLEHALSQTKIETSEVPLSQIQNRWGYSFNGYVYLLEKGD